MVVFACNHCGESLKKQAVEKHSFRCSRNIFVSCMDCQKDFKGEEYDAHIKCISEMEKYSAKGYVPKPNQNKGAKKQEAWVEMVRSIQQSQKNISINVNKVLTTISKHDNIPRKRASFIRFLQNSFRYMKMPDIEAAWNLLDEEMKKNKSAVTNGNANGNTNGVSNGQENHQNGAKRKLEDDEQESEPKSEEPEIKSSKKKIKLDESQEETETTNGVSKFDWATTIKDILLSKNNQLKLNKLKKKVFRRYKACTGTEEISDKIERKFNKKLRKLGLIVKEDTVQLIE
uniref:CSON004272 protein n=1 Tax=Culicoides sonorensis TaxID=179676 RepID=A0A336L4P7_CULSO